MGRKDEPGAVHPADPLNSYQPASWRGVIITAVAIIVAIVAIWLAYSAARNNPDLQRDMDGRQEIQGGLFPAQPQPGGN